MVRGRPREFDTQDALDRVLAVFWRDGFDAASMQALADAVGVSKPSLYAAYDPPGDPGGLNNRLWAVSAWAPANPTVGVPAAWARASRARW